MPAFQIILGVVMGFFIWFFLGVIFEESALRRIKEKKYGKDSQCLLSKQDKQNFYIPLAVFSVVAGIFIAYLGQKGLLPNS